MENGMFVVSALDRGFRYWVDKDGLITPHHERALRFDTMRSAHEVAIERMVKTPNDGMDWHAASWLSR